MLGEPDPGVTQVFPERSAGEEDHGDIAASLAELAEDLHRRFAVFQDEERVAGRPRMLENHPRITAYVRRVSHP